MPESFEGPNFQRPSKELMEALKSVSSATATGFLARKGIRDAQLKGIQTFKPDVHIVGPALTCQFMPKREDIHGSAEYGQTYSKRNSYALSLTQPGDIFVVDARGDLSSGIAGEMLLTYFTAKGGIGVVADGCVRDFPYAKHLPIGFFLKGVTPNYHMQTNIVPYAVNVPVGCGGVYIEPGDIIIADDDGVVVCPIKLAPELAADAATRGEKEEFIRMRLSQGGELKKYYPLHDESLAEYEEWKKAQGK